MADQVIQLQPPALVQKGAASAKIVGSMAVAAIFAIVGAELRNASGTKPSSDSLGVALGSPFLIIAGSTVATAILVGVADFGGQAGETFAVGLAGVVLLSSVLISGGPVWKAISSAFTKTAHPAATATSTASAGTTPGQATAGHAGPTK